MMTSYNGQTITYDAIGNPLTYRDGITLTWQNGRELASFSNNNYDITYSYDADGMRTTKRIDVLGDVKYVYEGSLLLQMDYLGKIFDFSYDANGTPIGFRVTEDGKADEYYYYGVNSRGDIVSIYNVAGGEVVQYTYDAYGKILSEYSTTGYSTIATANPLRYRGYVYDRETGLYYLQSRYYDPKTCRFVNGDIQLNIDSFNGYNQFAYCENNPIMYYDPTGTREFACCPYGDCYHCKAKKKASVLPEAMPDEAPVGFANAANSSYSLTNHVQEIHVTTPTALIDAGPWIGKIGFSSTVTKQDKEPGLAHITSDIGNDASNYSAGLNFGGWLGADVGVSSEANAFICAQVTPWVHGEASLGFDGIGAVIGLDVGDVSYDFEIKGGLGLVALIFAPQYFMSGVQLNGSPS